jgi:hypothetical protein
VALPPGIGPPTTMAYACQSAMPEGTRRWIGCLFWVSETIQVRLQEVHKSFVGRDSATRPNYWPTSMLNVPFSWLPLVSDDSRHVVVLQGAGLILAKLNQVRKLSLGYPDAVLN